MSFHHLLHGVVDDSSEMETNEVEADYLIHVDQSVDST